MTPQPLLLFPDDATISHVPQCTTGRVFVVRVHGLRHFYWLQDASMEKDSERIEKLRSHFRYGPRVPGASSTLSPPPPPQIVTQLRPHQAAAPQAAIPQPAQTQIAPRMSADEVMRIIQSVATPPLSLADVITPEALVAAVQSHPDILSVLA
jgi:hypothetical protein